MFNKQKGMVSLHHSKAKKILLMNPKGGVGKSTCSAALMSHLSHLGYSVEVIDFDKQRLCYGWAKEVFPDSCQPYVPSFRSLSNIGITLKVKRNTDFVVIDSPSNFTEEEMTRYTYFIDAILLPISPSPLDLQASLQFIESIIESGILSRRNISLAFLLNRCRVDDNRVEITSHSLKNFQCYPTLGKMSENTQYQDAFHYKKNITVFCR